MSGTYHPVLTALQVVGFAKGRQRRGTGRRRLAGPGRSMVGKDVYCVSGEQRDFVYRPVGDPVNRYRVDGRARARN